jgi:transglutaminase-like putative cysteine protease
MPLEMLNFLTCRGPVRPTPKLTPALDAVRPPPGTRVAEVMDRVGRWLQATFTYAPDVTNASSPIDDILDHGKGVCQDFAHLMIALLRTLGVPVRYVSGYIHRPNKGSQSHAWCEVWIPDLGWVGIDPTNDTLITDHFVKVAIGRDYSDVPPNKGVYKGQAYEEMFVRVETRELSQLPSLSWRDQLPPLEVPLTAIRPRIEAPPRKNETEQEQQQQ